MRALIELDLEEVRVLVDGLGARKDNPTLTHEEKVKILRLIRKFRGVVDLWVQQT